MIVISSIIGQGSSKAKYIITDKKGIVVVQANDELDFMEKREAYLLKQGYTKDENGRFVYKQPNYNPNRHPSG